MLEDTLQSKDVRFANKMVQLYSNLEIFRTFEDTISVHFVSGSQTVLTFHLETVPDMSNLVLIWNTGPKSDITCQNSLFSSIILFDPSTSFCLTKQSAFFQPGPVLQRGGLVHMSCGRPECIVSIADIICFFYTKNWTKCGYLNRFTFKKKSNTSSNVKINYDIIQHYIVLHRLVYKNIDIVRQWKSQIEPNLKVFSMWILYV